MEFLDIFSQLRIESMCLLPQPRLAPAALAAPNQGNEKAGRCVVRQKPPRDLS